jgi:hypothetical protein
MLRWVFEQLGGGIIYKFQKGPPREKGKVEKIVSFPVVTNVLGRFVRVSDYGRQEQLEEVRAGVEQLESRQRLDDLNAVNRGVLAAVKAKASTRAEIKPFQDQALINVFGTTNIKGKENLERANKILDAFKLTLVRGKTDSAIWVLIRSTTNSQKIAVMKQLRANMTLEDYKEFANTARRLKVISGTVINKASKQE